MLLTAFRGSFKTLNKFACTIPRWGVTVTSPGSLALRAVSDMHHLAFFSPLNFCVMHVTQIIPFFYVGVEVRTVSIDDEKFLVAKDVCTALGIKEHRRAVADLDPDERRECVVRTPSGNQKMVCVNESGLYHLIFRSRKPEAREFRKWVTNIVLPSIRKSGNFTVTSYALEPSGQLALFPHNESHVRNEIKKQMMEVALSTRSTTVRKLLRLLKPIVFTTQTQQGDQL